MIIWGGEWEGEVNQYFNTGGRYTPPIPGYTAGTVISLTAVPVYGYEFSSWTGSGGTFSSTTNTNTNFTITGTASITANYVQTCIVNCTATVPTTGPPQTPIGFQSTYSLINCTGTPTFLWNFGDSQTSTAQNVNHTYASAGTFNWTLTVTLQGKTCVKNGTIAISGVPCRTFSSAANPSAGGMVMVNTPGNCTIASATFAGEVYSAGKGSSIFDGIEVKAPEGVDTYGVSYRDRLLAQEKIERIYHAKRIWPKDNPGEKPPFEKVVTREVIESKVKTYLNKSADFEAGRQNPISQIELDREIERIKSNTRDKGTLESIFSALLYDPEMIRECLGRQTIIDRMEFGANVKGIQTPESSPNPETASDTWLSTSTGANCPSARRWHTAIWTGVEMIIWGGSQGASIFNTGGRYNSITDAWSATSITANCPQARYWHTAVWTGTEMIIWAGCYGNTTFNDGGKYNPISDTWAATAIGVSCPSTRRNHTAIWAGTEMIVWGGFRWDGSYHNENTGGRYNPVSNSWIATSVGVNCPSGRSLHSAVWTGNEMIIWGGLCLWYDYPNYEEFNTGARYNPSSDTWITIPVGTNCPIARHSHTAIWTGNEMIIWGGVNESYLNSGGRYLLNTDTWTSTSIGTNCPSARMLHTAIWTGTEMIVWGGQTNDGGRYIPGTDSWYLTSTGSNCPSVRDGHSAIWSGVEMIVWGGYYWDGYNDYYLNTGGRYTPPIPGYQQGTAISLTAVPAADSTFSGWTGSGGTFSSTSNLNTTFTITGNASVTANFVICTISCTATVPSSGTTGTAVSFQATATATNCSGAPTYLWDFGDGQTSTQQDINHPYTAGGSYNWTLTATIQGKSCVKSGTIIISDPPCYTFSSAANPSAGGMVMVNTPGNCTIASATFAGEVYSAGKGSSIFNGIEVKAPEGVDTYGVSYRDRLLAQEKIERIYHAKRIWPKDNPGEKPAFEKVVTRDIIEKKVKSYLERSASLGSERQSAVNKTELDGEIERIKSNTRDKETLESIFSALSYDPEMIRECLARQTIVDRMEFNNDVKGVPQIAESSPNPETASDTWLSTSTGANCPSARYNHTAVWTGAEMIVWGGMSNNAYNTGGRYNPVTDTWVPTSTSSSCPSARTSHTAVWTGTEMIVWGGGSNTGGRYNPLTDSWIPTSTGINCPDYRSFFHVAVWTGKEMIIWGGMGINGSNYLNTGAKYSPATDTWMPTSTDANCPSGREYLLAIWTGTEMIVWGGRWYDGSMHYENTGGRYNPDTDTWSAISTGTNCPSARSHYAMTWSGKEMVIWGGYDGVSFLNNGGRYNPSTNSWQSTSTGTNCPYARFMSTAIWTGAEMIIWGGGANTGGRYNPTTDTWKATSTGTNCPTIRYNHKAIWTGAEMIIWGGYWYDASNNMIYLNTGGRYTPPIPGYQQGTSISLTAVPANGYAFNNWSGTGGTFSSTTNATTTFTITSNASVAANFNYCMPSAPTGVTATTNRAPDVQVSWNSVTGATSYNVYRGTACGTALDTFTNVTSPYSDTSAVAGTNYQYWVVAVNSCGTSGNSTCAAGLRVPAPEIVYQTIGPFSQVIGDGDQWFEKGEKWLVPVTVKNIGAGAATNVTAALSGNGITLCNSPGTYGSVPAGGSATYIYEFLISSTFSPCGGTIGFDMSGKTSTELTPAGADENDIFFVTVGQSSTGVATELVIQPSSADSWVNQAASTTNYGTATIVYAQNRASNARRTLVKFDLSQIPAGSSINSATLEIYAASAPAVSQTLNVHRVTGSWTETGVTWSTMPTFNSTADASITGGTTSGWKVWNVLPVLRSWVDGTYENDGFIIKCATETGTTTYSYSFASKEYATAGYRPVLRVNYTPTVSWICGYVGSGACQTCVSPGAPVITNMADTDSCGGFTMTFNSGSPATRHDLYIDGSLVQKYVTSPLTFSTGDTASHEYRIRAVNGSDICYSDSVAYPFADVYNMPSRPVISSVVDLNSSSSTGVQVNYSAGTPAARHDLYVDGVLVLSSFASGGTYSPANSDIHSYVVRAVNGSCFNESVAVLGRDDNSALSTSTKVLSWGSNHTGELGNSGDIGYETTPVQVINIADVCVVAEGYSHTMAAKNNGTIWAWGKNSNGQLGNGTNLDSPVPVQVKNLFGIKMLAGGESHSLALKNDGTVWAWGNNSNGQLGNGTYNSTNTPIKVSNIDNIVMVRTGDYHSLAIRSDGTVWGWGANWYGQLGNGTYDYANTPVQVPGLTNIVSISAGYAHSLALKSDGTVWAWGYNDTGELGNGTNDTTNVPVQVLNISNVVAIASGMEHSVALKIDGTVWCWGANYSGQLGDGTWENSNMPVQVSDSFHAISIAAGESHTLAIKEDGSAWMWGGVWYWNSGFSYSTPTQMTTFGAVLSMASGGGHLVALKNDKTVWTMGENIYGQLGNGKDCKYPHTQIVDNLQNVAKVSGGMFFTVALKTDGTVWAWGNNERWQVGEGNGEDIITPTQKTSLCDITDVSAGGYHSLALKNGGTVWAWGANWEGQLGNGSSEWPLEPVHAVNLSNVIAVSAGGNHSLALRNDGTVWAWGANIDGQIGNGTNDSSNIPVQLTSLTNIIAISAGYSHSLALQSNGKVWAWGANWGGQLGIGSTSSSNVPVLVSDITGITAISGGDSHSLALQSDGTIWAWGSNWEGQLGNGSWDESDLPIHVSNLTNITAISANGYHSLALKNDGTVWTWGLNMFGQLGDGTFDHKNVPVQLPDLKGFSSISAGELHSLAVIGINCTPSAPILTGISDPDTCGSGINITFTPGASAARHDLYVDGSAAQSGITSPLFYVPEDDLAHRYKIAAVNTCGTTDSNAMNFTDADGGVVTPVISSVADIDPCALTGVLITWNIISGAVGYDLLVDSTDVVTGVNSPYTYLSDNTSPHDFQIRATSSSCTSQWSNIFSGSDGNGSPLIPLGVTATPVCTGVTITWSPSDGATSYNVKRGTTCGTALATYTNVTSPYTDTTAVAGTTYNYWVVAVNSCGTSGNSSCVTAKKLQAPTTPSAPTYSNIGCSTVTINWVAVSGATSYDLYRKTGTCGTGTIVQSNISSTTFNDSGLNATTQYSYYLVAKNECGSSSSGTCSSVTTTGTPATPTAPTFTNIGCVSLTVNWVAASGATSYDLYRKSGTCGTGTLVASDISGTSYNDNGLAGSSQYSYYLIAKNSCGNSTSGTCASVTTAVCAPNIVFQSAGVLTQITGDDDEWYEKGEKWSVPVTLANAGNIMATNVTAALSGDQVTICNTPGTFGNIPAGGTASFIFEFVISDSFSPCGGSIGFDISGKTSSELTPAGGDENDIFSVTVGQQSSGWASTDLVIQPSAADSYLNQQSTSTNYGTATSVSVMSRTGMARRVPVQFDLSGIPANSTINSATLELYATTVSGSQTLNVHRISGSWLENTVTWANQPSYDSTADSSIAGGTAAGWKIWDVTSLVQEWIDGTSANYGFLVKCSTETGPTSISYTFASKENATTANRPILRINYASPVSWDCGYVGSGTCVTCNPPSAPEITGISDINQCSQNGVTITFDPGSPATRHDLYVDSALAVSNIASPLTYIPQDTNSHIYSVRAVNGLETCVTDSDFMNGTDRNDHPGTPSAPSVTDISGCSLSGVTISWAPIPGASGYDLLVDSTSVIETITSPYNYTPGNTVTHTYQVRAINASCTGSWSSGTTGADINNGITSPVVTGATDVDTCSLSGVNISWTSVSGATAYDLNIDSSNIIPNVTSPFLYTPGNNSTHSYQVRAKNAACFSEWSTQATGADLANSAPLAPLAPSFSDIQQASLVVSWNSVVGATSYDVWRLAGSSCSGAIKITNVPVTTTSYQDINLECNTQYSYYVTANGPCGTSQNGGCASTTTALCSPAVPWKEAIWIAAGNVVTANFDGTEQSTLLDNTENLANPKLSKDRTKLAYVKSATTPEICVWDGTTTKCVQAPGYIYDFDWHPDGNRIFYGKNQGDGQIWVIDYSVTTPAASLFFDPPVYRTFGVAISADGTKMTMIHDPANNTYNNYLASYSFATSSQTSIYSGNGKRDFFCSSSPKEHEVVWSQGNASDKMEVWRINDDGTNAVNLSTATATVDRNYPKYSPDGNQIFYVEGTSLKVMGRDGGTPLNVMTIASSAQFTVAANYCYGTLSAPTVVDVDGCQLSGVTITWTATPGASGYDLYVDSTTLVPDVTSPYVYQPGDSNNHSYQVRAKGPSCTGFWSSISTCTDQQGVGCGDIPPEISTGTSIADSQQWSADKITQSWQAPGVTITGYNLYRGIQSNLPGLASSSMDFCTRYTGTNTSVELSEDDPSAVDGKCYYYLVTAFNELGEGSPGNMTSGERQINSIGNCQ
jgi:alpha-tubulin suppressor-like RCC1 family protein/fibronectin type 3 domain-containing protein